MIINSQSLFVILNYNNIRLLNTNYPRAPKHAHILFLKSEFRAY